MVFISQSSLHSLYSHFTEQSIRDEWPSGLNSFCQVTEVKLGRVRSDSGWVTSEA